MFNSVGPTELLIVLGIVLLIFGPKRLPGLGRQLGKGMREFKESVTGEDGKDTEPDQVERETGLPPADAPAPAPDRDAAGASAEHSKT